MGGIEFVKLRELLEDGLKGYEDWNREEVDYRDDGMRRLVRVLLSVARECSGCVCGYSDSGASRVVELFNEGVEILGCMRVFVGDDDVESRRKELICSMCILGRYLTDCLGDAHGKRDNMNVVRQSCLIYSLLYVTGDGESRDGLVECLRGIREQMGVRGNELAVGC